MKVIISILFVSILNAQNPIITSSLGSSSTLVHQYGGGFGSPGGTALSSGGIIYFDVPQNWGSLS